MPLFIAPERSEGSRDERAQGQAARYRGFTFLHDFLWYELNFCTILSAKQATARYMSSPAPCAKAVEN